MCSCRKNQKPKQIARNVNVNSVPVRQQSINPSQPSLNMIQNTEKNLSTQQNQKANLRIIRQRIIRQKLGH